MILQQQSTLTTRTTMHIYNYDKSLYLQQEKQQWIFTKIMYIYNKKNNNNKGYFLNNLVTFKNNIMFLQTHV